MGSIRTFGNLRRWHGEDSTPTPRHVYEQLHREFHFTLDVAASAENVKCPAFFSKEEDGLSRPWSGVVFCNPPYSDIGPWMRKGLLESARGVTSVFLVPARTDLAWFHDYALEGEVRFIRGRLNFTGTATNAPFPSCVVIFRPRPVLPTA